MSVKKDHHISSGSDGSIVSGPDQTFSFRVSDKLHFGIIRFLDLLLEPVMKMLQF